MIPNHFAARMSELDLQVISHVPPGGNWKNIPESVPSQRLVQIRESFARGEGSRSTYYGRLKPNAPSYTINTYFTRPGNGCHIHYEQDRVISHREAARLQSFPDSFEFIGSRAATAVQIGNAVPPLLAYRIAKSFGTPGEFVDLFAGAGGLTLGFIWAGWKPLVANDIDARAMATYAHNIDEHCVVGDIRSEDVAADILRIARSRRTPSVPLLIVGGPPCQGFSTAGHRRSLDDERNHLFLDYRRLVDSLDPDAFVFENVMGLLNMQRGAVFSVVTGILSEAAEALDVWKVQAEQHGIPQRRSRVLVVGSRRGTAPTEPGILTAFPPELAEATGVLISPCVADATSDLPPLRPGEDGSTHPYVSPPANPYQSLMRGMSTAHEYVAALECAAASRHEQLSIAAA